MLYADLIAIGDLGFGIVIGSGSFGVVHKGVYKGRSVALKRLKVPPGISTSSLEIPKEVSILKYV